MYACVCVCIFLYIFTKYTTGSRWLATKLKHRRTLATTKATVRKSSSSACKHRRRVFQVTLCIKIASYILPRAVKYYRLGRKASEHECSCAVVDVCAIRPKTQARKQLCLRLRPSFLLDRSGEYFLASSSSSTVNHVLVLMNSV